MDKYLLSKEPFNTTSLALEVLTPLLSLYQHFRTDTLLHADTSFFLSLFICFEREKEEQREKETESQAGFMLSAQSPMTGFEFTNHEIMTWAEVGRFTNWATQEHQYLIFF